ncbi:hypothetical protein [Microcoleus sp. Pol12B5]|uniref:hypothetical protein n=1 Tax=unclassified Microcoleus TaxID=2642155 RepID=UPI002FD29817
MGWLKQSEADGGGESETQSSAGGAKEAGFISPAVFNCGRVLVGDACFFLGNSGEVDRTLGEIY